MAQQVQIQAVEMNYMRVTCGESHWEEKSKETVYERFSMAMTAKVVDYGVVEHTKCGTLRWFGYVKEE